MCNMQRGGVTKEGRGDCRGEGRTEEGRDGSGGEG